MSGQANPKQMPDWLRRKLKTAEQANNIFMNWVTSIEWMKQADSEGRGVRDLVKHAFSAAEAFDKHLEEYLQEPRIQEPSKGIHLT